MNNKKGFTLVELLAVIVILGLLMAIAIPSVTKYITESRKKTLVSSINSYINAVVTQVNDGEYKFSYSTKIFGIPIECIPLEKGGTNPFGNWMQANNNYWAYVLVQYDNVNYNYKYGFTFKDDAGYAMYPTESSLIDNNVIRNGLELRRPLSGAYTNIAEKDDWSGFNLDNDPRVKILKSSEDGENGDGQNTCTLQRKGDNYSSVLEEEKDLTLMKFNINKAFWQYRESIKTITFENRINIPDDVYDSWDVSNKGNGMVMAYIKKNPSNSSYYDLYIQANGEIYANPDSSQLFRNFYYLDRINNIDIFNTSNVTNMASMFEKTGYESTVFSLDLGTNFDTSKVTNMSNMFFFAGNKSTNFTLNLGPSFDTSNVTNMSGMFRALGYTNQSFTLNLGNKFDTSKVTNMSYMFYGTGLASKVITLDFGSKFDTSNVTDMTAMFYQLGYNNKNFKLNLGNKFNTSKVTNMKQMFSFTGYSSTVFELNLGSKFNTENVLNMDSMFTYCGRSAPNFKLDCSGWKVDKVTTHQSFDSYVESKIIDPEW